MVHMWRVSKRSKHNGHCFQVDLPFTRGHLLTSTPISFFQHSLGTAELIQMLFDSISWKALSRNHIFYWGKEPDMLCFRMPKIGSQSINVPSYGKRKKEKPIHCVFIILRAIWISEVGKWWRVKKCILELSKCNTTQVLVKKHPLGRLGTVFQEWALNLYDPVTTALMTKEQ